MKIETLRNSSATIRIPNILKEDRAFFIKQIVNAANENDYNELVEKIYKHGYEDGYYKGRKYGKIIKLVNI